MHKSGTFWGVSNTFWGVYTVYKSENQNNFPVSRRLLRRVLSLPLHEKMTDAQEDYVVSMVNKFYRQKKK